MRRAVRGLDEQRCINKHWNGLLNNWRHVSMIMNKRWTYNDNANRIVKKTKCLAERRSN